MLGGVFVQDVLKNQLSSNIDTILLPSGEYKEHVIVDRPCTIVGNNTTLWNDTLPVVRVKSKGVVLKNLRLELTGISGYEDDYAVLQVQDDTVIQDVEVFGGVAGCKKTYIPRTLHLGTFKSECENSYTISVYVFEPTEVISNCNAITIRPSAIGVGANEITITVNPLRDGSMVYGDILFKSKYIRRVYVDGKSLSTAQKVQSLELYDYNSISKGDTNTVVSLDTIEAMPSVTPVNSVAPSIKADTTSKATITDDTISNRVLVRGQRVTILDSSITVKLSYSKLIKPMDIDPYIFLTDATNHTRFDEDVVFFSNRRAKDSIVELKNDNSVYFNLNDISPQVQRISICYSIYLGGSQYDRNKDFSKVENPKVEFLSNGKPIYTIPLTDLNTLSTVIVAEMYRYKGNWKINPVVAGYKEGLPKLCKSFGVDAEY